MENRHEKYRKPTWNMQLETRIRMRILPVERQIEVPVPDARLPQVRRDVSGVRRTIRPGNDIRRIFRVFDRLGNHIRHIFRLLGNSNPLQSLPFLCRKRFHSPLHSKLRMPEDLEISPGTNLHVREDSVFDWNGNLLRVSNDIHGIGKAVRLLGPGSVGDHLLLGDACDFCVRIVCQFLMRPQPGAKRNKT